MNVGKLLNTLESRLPELEWRIGYLDSLMLERSLPPGLFKPGMEMPPSFYIDEIKSDIKALARQESNQSAFFLANRIQQKINVLIALCKANNPESSNQNKIYSLTKMINTRNQQVTLLETEIRVLETQKKALEKTAEDLQNKNQNHAFLKLHLELSEIKKKLTLAREELQRFIS